MTSECCTLGPCRWLLPLLLLSLAAAPSLAQSRAGDRMSGAWTGYIGESAASPHEIRFQFTRKADGSLAGTATGPELTPGELESGTFDAGTGALKFTVLIRSHGGEGGRAYFEGRVVHDTASGTVRFDDPNMRGIFRIVRQDPNAPAAAAPAAPKGDPGAAVRRGLVEVSDWLVRAAEMVPEERYSYRPVGTVRTFGQLVAHVVDGSNYYCARASGRQVDWSDATERTVTTKSALVQALRKALADCKSAYEGAGEIGPMMENLVHDGLHYGNMVTYMRMMGLVPPSSG